MRRLALLIGLLSLIPTLAYAHSPTTVRAVANDDDDGSENHADHDDDDDDGRHADRRDALPLKTASLHVEINATDGDAGIQPFLDGEPWKKARVLRPDGKKLFEVETKGELDDYGLTELFSESSEPPFTEFSLDQFLELFPAGTYVFEVTGIDGTRYLGEAELTHDFPAPVELISPAEDATVPTDGLVLEWEPATEDVEIVAYEALVVSEDTDHTFLVELPASVTQVAVPSAFLVPGAEYKVEISAIEVSGNRTLIEVPFFTAG